MDFVEYMQARNAVNLNSAEDKLDWIFCLFDSDGGGSVDLNEIEVEIVFVFDFPFSKRTFFCSLCVLWRISWLKFKANIYIIGYCQKYF